MVAYFVHILTRPEYDLWEQARCRSTDCRPASSGSWSSLCAEVSSISHRYQILSNRFQVELPVEDQGM